MSKFIRELNRKIVERVRELIPENMDIEPNTIRTSVYDVEDLATEIGRAFGGNTVESLKAKLEKKHPQSDISPIVCECGCDVFVIMQAAFDEYYCCLNCNKAICRNVHGGKEVICI